jgi:hypothetical protein
MSLRPAWATQQDPVSRNPKQKTSNNAKPQLYQVPQTPSPMWVYSFPIQAVYLNDQILWEPFTC